MRMAPQSYFILVFYIIIFVCCPLCLVSSFQEEDSSHSGDGLHKFVERKIYDISKRTSKDVTPQTSPKIVNVDDFGAKGNASDDSEVMFDHLFTLISVEGKFMTFLQPSFHTFHVVLTYYHIMRKH